MPLYTKDDVGFLLAYVELEYLYGDEYKLSLDKNLGPALHGLIEHTKIAVGYKDKGSASPFPDWHLAWEMVAKFFFERGARLHRNVFLAFTHEVLAPGVPGMTEHGVIGCSRCASLCAKPEIALACTGIARGAMDMRCPETYMQHEPPFVAITFTGTRENLTKLERGLPQALRNDGPDEHIPDSLCISGAVQRGLAAAGDWAQKTANACNLNLVSFYGLYTRSEE